MMRPRADSWAKPQHPAPIQCTWHLWLMGKKRTDRHTCTDIDQAAWHFKKGIKGAKAACSITKTCCRSTRGAFSPNQEWKSVSVAGASGLLLSFASHCRNDWNDCPYQQAQSYKPDHLVSARSGGVTTSLFDASFNNWPKRRLRQKFFLPFKIDWALAMNSGNTERHG